MLLNGFGKLKKNEVEKSCLSGSPKNKFDKKIKIFFLDRDCTEKLKNGLEVVYGWVVWELFQIPLTAALKWEATLSNNRYLPQPHLSAEIGPNIDFQRLA